MNLADHILGNITIPESRGRIVSPMGSWPEGRESPKRKTQKQPKVDDVGMRRVEALCRKLTTGITSAVVADMAGIARSTTHSFLSRLRDRGLLVQTGIVHTRGRPGYVYALRRGA